MNIEELKQRCLKEAEKNRQRSVDCYSLCMNLAGAHHEGAREAWQKMHKLLVTHFPEKQEKGLVVNDE